MCVCVCVCVCASFCLAPPPFDHGNKWEGVFSLWYIWVDCQRDDQRGEWSVWPVQTMAHISSCTVADCRLLTQLHMRLGLPLWVDIAVGLRSDDHLLRGEMSPSAPPCGLQRGGRSAVLCPHTGARRNILIFPTSHSVKHFPMHAFILYCIQKGTLHMGVSSCRRKGNEWD